MFSKVSWAHSSGHDAGSGAITTYELQDEVLLEVTSKWICINITLTFKLRTVYRGLLPCQQMFDGHAGRRALPVTKIGYGRQE